MSSQLVDLRTDLTPRRSALASVLVLPVVDGLALLVCFLLGGLVNFSFENVTEERSLIWWCWGRAAWRLFHHFGHYIRRRQLWQEFGDIAGVAAVALVLDLALLYLLKVNFSRAVGADQLGAGGAGGAARAAAGQAGGPGAGALAAADGDRRAPGPTRARSRPPTMPATTIWATRCRRSWTPTRMRSSGPCGSAGATSRCCRWTRRPRSCRAGWASRTWWWRLELDQMLGREGLIESLSFYHGDIDVISPLKGLPINNTRVSHFFSRDILILRIHNNLARPWPQLVKRGFDLVAASAAAAVHRARCWRWWRRGSRMVDGGGVIFAHTRVGRHGRLFPCYKFRTMVANSAEVLAELLAATRRRGPSGPRTASCATTRGSRRSAGSCARPASTSCRSCSTWSAAR